MRSGGQVVRWSLNGYEEGHVNVVIELCVLCIWSLKIVRFSMGFHKVVFLHLGVFSSIYRSCYS